MTVITISDRRRAEAHRHAIRRFNAALAARPDARVPFYPNWTVRDLAVHLISVHTMAAVAVETAAAERPSFNVTVSASDEPATLAVALRAVIERLDHALTEAPLTSIWAVLPERHPQAWRRRMLFEATLHGFDAQTAVGEPDLIPTEVARDGIDEFLQLHARKGLLGADLTGVLEVRDDTGRWHIDLATAEAQRTEGTAAAASAQRRPGAVLTGAPDALWLWMNRREPRPSEVEVDDRDGIGKAFARVLDGLNRPKGSGS